MLKDAYLDAKIGVDAAENEPNIVQQPRLPDGLGPDVRQEVQVHVGNLAEGVEDLCRWLK